MLNRLAREWLPEFGYPKTHPTLRLLHAAQIGRLPHFKGDIDEQSFTHDQGDRSATGCRSRTVAASRAAESRCAHNATWPDRNALCARSTRPLHEPLVWSVSDDGPRPRATGSRRPATAGLRLAGSCPGQPARRLCRSKKVIRRSTCGGSSAAARTVNDFIGRRLGLDHRFGQKMYFGVM